MRSRQPKQTLSADILWADREKLFEILRTAPSLVVAIVITSYLDASLTSLLRQSLSEVEFGAVRDSFGGRCKAAYERKLIDKATLDDLNKVGKIRNRFAHHYLALEFDDAEVVKLCDSLSLNRDPINVKTGKPMKVPHHSEASRVRVRFLMMALHFNDRFLVRVRGTDQDA